MIIINETLLKEMSYVFFSFISSVSIIFINKFIYTGGYEISGNLLMSLHFFSNYLIALLLNYFSNTNKLFECKILPIKTRLLISFHISLGLFTANVSLIHNPITVYQLTKILATPCTLIINYILYKSLIEFKIFISVMIVVSGMTFVMFGEIYLNVIGSFIALSAIIFGATSQIAISHYSKENKVNGFELLLNHSLFSGILMGVLAIPLDGMESVTNSFVLFFTNFKFMFYILLSCFASFAVNVANYLVIGKLSPLTFQILGHSKTISVIIGGYLLFGRDGEMSFYKIIGIIISLFGTFLYSYYKYLEEIERLKSNILPTTTNEDVKPLLNDKVDNVKENDVATCNNEKTV